MMMSEFTERTNIEPSLEEYHYIEESYYESNMNKDEFCRKWLKDKETGKWYMEYKYRKALDGQKAMYEAKIKEKEETIEFYRNTTEQLTESYIKAKKRGEEARKKLRKVMKALEEE